MKSVRGEASKISISYFYFFSDPSNSTVLSLIMAIASFFKMGDMSWATRSEKLIVYY